MIAALLALIAVLAVLARGLWRLLRAVGLSVRPGWRFGCGSLLRRPLSVLLQLVAFGIGLMALLVTVVVGKDILTAWRAQIPAHAPNHFAFNIQAQELPALQQVFAGREIAIDDFYPMARARLVAVGERELDPDDYPLDSRERHLLTRDYNLSFAESARADYVIESGAWWTQAELSQPLLSIESSIARHFDLELGDQLRFRIAGAEVEGRVANIRTVDWDSLKPNFYIISTPSLLAEQPSTLITSFRVDGDSSALINDLVQVAPGVTVLNFDALLAQVRGLVDNVALVVQYVLGFVLLAGTVVLLATVQASRWQRVREVALLKALGATRRTVWFGLFAEFLLLGSLAGLIGAVIAGGLGWGVAYWLLEIDYIPSYFLLVLGVLSGAVVITLSGLLFTRQALRSSAMQLLRDH